MFKDKSELYIDQAAKKIVFHDRFRAETLTYADAKKSTDKQFLKRLKYIRSFLSQGKSSLPKPKPVQMKKSALSVPALSLKIPDKI